jgi:hypothetical protein
MKRKRIWLGTFLILFLLGVGAFFLWPRDRITPESYEKIKIGMTDKEVESILGSPGVQKKWNSFVPLPGAGEKVVIEHCLVGQDCNFWESRRCVIALQFDEARIVTGRLSVTRSPHRNLWERLWDWLGW